MSVGPDLDPNCLQRLSADDTSRQRVKILDRLMFLENGMTSWILNLDI